MSDEAKALGLLFFVTIGLYFYWKVILNFYTIPNSKV